MTVPVPQWRRRLSAAVDMTGQVRANWHVSRRGGNVGGSATWWAQHECTPGKLAPEQLVLGTQLRAGHPKYCNACRPKPPGTVTLTGKLRAKRKPRE